MILFKENISLDYDSIREIITDLTSNEHQFFINLSFF